MLHWFPLFTFLCAFYSNYVLRAFNFKNYRNENANLCIDPPGAYLNTISTWPDGIDWLLGKYNYKRSDLLDILNWIAHCKQTNSPVTGEFPEQRPVTRSFEVFFDLRLNNGWVNNAGAGDLRLHHAHHDITVMIRVYFHIYKTIPSIYFRRKITVIVNCDFLCV